MPHAHVIGGGLAGLAAACTLADQGWKISLYEAGPACGGRCRSYHDQTLGRVIDNGNHLLLSCNHAAFAFLDRLGTRGTLRMPSEPVFPFYEIDTGVRWALRPSPGRLPLFLFDPARRVPGTGLADYLALLRLVTAGRDATLAQALPDSVLLRKLIAPIAISALNTPIDQASSALFLAVVRETLFAGGRALIPAFPAHGLSASFIDPAIAKLEARGARIHLSTRVSALAIEDNNVQAIHLPDGPHPLSGADRVVLAVPPNIAQQLLPGLRAPDQFESILNIHYQVSADAGETGFLGLLGGLAEWVFIKGDIASITLSAANRLIAQDADALAGQIWPEIRAALRLDPAMPCPLYRVVKEKRATFAATPAMDRLRPRVQDGPANLALAGDWTQTGLPATIEGAIRSGLEAARHAAHI